MASQDNDPRSWFERNALTIITVTLAALMALVIYVQVGC